MSWLLISILITLQVVHAVDERVHPIPQQGTNGVHSHPVENEELSPNGGRIFADADGPPDKLPINQCGNPICPLIGQAFIVGEVVYVLHDEVPNIPFNRQVDCISENGMIRLMTEHVSGPNVRTWKHPLNQRLDSPDRSVADYKRFHLVRSIPILQAPRVHRQPLDPNNPFRQDPDDLPPNLGADFIQQTSSQQFETRNAFIMISLPLVALLFSFHFFTSFHKKASNHVYNHFHDEV